MKNNLIIQQFNDCFAFVLGRETKIALYELESVLRRFGICFDILSLLENIVVIKVDQKSNIKNKILNIMEALGGTIKIYQISNIKYQISEKELLISNKISNIQGAITDLLIRQTAGSQRPSGTLNFSISDYSGEYNAKQLNEMGIKVKIQARKTRPVRFIAGKEAVLSSAASYHKIYKTGGEEIGIFRITNNQFSITNEIPKTKFLMPNEMSNDQKNLSLEINNLDLPATLVIDPFCGSGNILMEAKMLGCEIMGSDLSEKAIEDTKANLQWLSQKLKVKSQNLPTGKQSNQSQIVSENINFQYQVTNEMTKTKSKGDVIARDEVIFNNSTIQHFKNDFVFKADATRADFVNELKNRRTEKQKNIVLVTEPYLGKPKKIKYKKEKIKDEIIGLKYLYLGFFNNIKLLATSYSLLAITFVFPVISTSDAGEISLYEECVDELAEMGYNPQCTLRYGRDYQVVKRQIAVITLEKS